LHGTNESRRLSADAPAHSPRFLQMPPSERPVQPLTRLSPHSPVFCKVLFSILLTDYHKHDASFLKTAHRMSSHDIFERRIVFSHRGVSGFQHRFKCTVLLENIC